MNLLIEIILLLLALIYPVIFCLYNLPLLPFRTEGSCHSVSALEFMFLVTWLIDISVYRLMTYAFPPILLATTPQLGHSDETSSHTLAWPECLKWHLILACINDHFHYDRTAMYTLKVTVQFII